MVNGFRATALKRYGMIFLTQASTIKNKWLDVKIEKSDNVFIATFTITDDEVKKIITEQYVMDYFDKLSKVTVKIFKFRPILGTDYKVEVF